MVAGPPRLGRVAAVAAVAALIAASRDLSELLRERSPSFAARLWPDPLADAERRVRELAAAGVDDPAHAAAEAKEASSRSPRDGNVHLLCAMLASDAREPAAARRELARANAADPWHGELQAAVARELLVDAIETGSADQLRAAADAFTRSVAVGALLCDEAYVALSAAEAPLQCLEQVAGRDPVRLERLVEHEALALDREAALAIAVSLDLERKDPDRRGVALAHRRLGAAFLAAKRPRDAAGEFEEAANMSADPDSLALDRADALLQAGEPAEGAAFLARALAAGHADALRASGSLRCAADPEAAKSAWFELAKKSGDPALRTSAAAVFTELGERARATELLATKGASRG
jgi:hypothetical protein